jgi:predicted S18 family serine protease
MNVLRHVDMVFSAYLGFINQCNKPLDKTEILLKLVLSTITIAPNPRLLHIIAKDMYYIDTSKYVQGLAEKVKHPLRGNIIVF